MPWSADFGRTATRFPATPKLKGLATARHLGEVEDDPTGRFSEESSAGGLAASTPNLPLTSSLSLTSQARAISRTTDSER